MTALASSAPTSSAGELVYVSEAMKRVDDAISRFAPSHEPVIIRGETGTGKELVATAIHNRSRRTGKLIVVNTAAFMDTAIESEFFGVAAKAFTDVSGRTGRWWLADKGSLFMDELGEMSPEFQQKLLRTVETGKFCRAGSTEEISADVRLIAATNRNLEEDVESGRFRRDLYFRFKVLQIWLPPLRERVEDVPVLATHFCTLLGSEDRSFKLSQAVIDLLMQHRWPGNVRELRNAIAHALLHCREDVILPEHLPEDIKRCGTIEHAPAPQVLIEQLPPLPAAPERLPPPLPIPIKYNPVVRNSLIQELLVRKLSKGRRAILLQPWRGGGRTLLRQLAPLCYGKPTAWLDTRGLGEKSSGGKAYRQLTGNDAVCDQEQLHTWLRSQVTEKGLLIALLGTHGNEEFLGEIAATVLSILSKIPTAMFAVVGGERLLRLRKCEHYAWLKVLPTGSIFDVPDLTVPEVATLLRRRSCPEELASMIWEETGGHPWLVDQLILESVSNRELARQRVYYHLRMEHQFERHLADEEDYRVLQTLLHGEHEVASLGDEAVRHEPASFAEARLYLSGFLRADPAGTRFRCPGARLLFDTELARKK